jgi:hypothetical protein
MPPPAATPALLQTTWTLPNAWIGDVADDAAHLRPKILQAFDGVRQRVRLDIGEHYFHAGLRKGPAERESDATGTAGHERRLAGQPPHVFPRYLLDDDRSYRLLLA